MATHKKGRPLLAPTFRHTKPRIEFVDGMRSLGYTAGELHKLFAEIDVAASPDSIEVLR